MSKLAAYRGGKFGRSCLRVKWVYEYIKIYGVYEYIAMAIGKNQKLSYFEDVRELDCHAHGLIYYSGIAKCNSKSTFCISETISQYLPKFYHIFAKIIIDSNGFYYDISSIVSENCIVRGTKISENLLTISIVKVLLIYWAAVIEVSNKDNLKIKC